MARDFEMNLEVQELLWGQLLPVVADQVEPALQQAITSDDFGLFEVLSGRVGGGNVLIADLEKKQVYGKVPALPFAAHKFAKQTKEILEQTCTRDNR